MKRNKRLIPLKYLFYLVLFQSIMFTGCESEVKITIPEIIQIPSDAGVFDTVTNIVIADASIDGKTVVIDSYSWNIYAEGNSHINILSENRDTITRVPNMEGDYMIEVTVNSDNKSVSKKSLNTFKNTIRTLQKALVGSWEGISDAEFYEVERIVHFRFEQNGHYSAFVLNAGAYESVLDNGNDSLDHPDKKLIIENIRDNGSATGYINFVHFDSSLLKYGIDDFIFLNDYNELSFISGHWYNEGQLITYYLYRQD